VTNILIVDDEPYVCDALGRVLEDLGYTVAIAASAEEGLQRLRDAGADLVIMDIIMRGMDGVAAIGVIRRSFPQVRIIAMTGGGSYGLSEYQPEAITTCAYLEAARKAGAHGVLSKPFETRQLCALIDQIAAPLPAEAL
jgi:CheY-like chemotaxis protein